MRVRRLIVAVLVAAALAGAATEAQAFYVSCDNPAWWLFC